MEFKREKYLNAMLESRHNGLIKVITGLRRVGKSYLMSTLFHRQLLNQGVEESHIIEIAFDDFGMRRYRDSETLYAYVKESIKDNKMYYLLLDEVQMLNDFVDVLNGFLHISNVDVYVTGSNARFLSYDIATEFRGRGTEIHIQPLSFKEYYEVFGGDRNNALQDYMLYGGLPMVLLQDKPEKKAAMLNELIRETYMSDILGRNRIKNDAQLADLFNILASNIGALTNPTKLANTFKSVKQTDIKSDTISRYIDYFKDSFLINEATRYDIKGRKYIGTPHKYYFADMGLRNAVVNFRQVEVTHLMENLLYNELLMRGYAVDVGSITSYRKNPEGKTERRLLEVDFVCNMGFKRCYVQSALNLNTEEKKEQEMASLLSIGDEFQKVIIEGGISPSHQNEQGIMILNVFDFLLNQNSLSV